MKANACYSRRWLFWYMLTQSRGNFLNSQITVDTNPWFIPSLFHLVHGAKPPGISHRHGFTLCCAGRRGYNNGDGAGTMEPNMLAYRLALLGAAAFLLIGLWFALKISDADAAATIRKSSGQGLFRRPKKSATLVQESSVQSKG